MRLFFFLLLSIPLNDLVFPYTTLFRSYLSGGSTLTQQIVKNTFLTPEKTLRRKMIEWFMSVVLERRLTKEQILDRKSTRLNSSHLVISYAVVCLKKKIK